MPFLVRMREPVGYCGNTYTYRVLLQVSQSIDLFGSFPDDSILQEEIDNREEELEYAFEDFAKTVGSGYYGLKLDDADALKEEVFEVFAKYIRVYRPGWYTDENDEDVFIEYPYEADDDSANNNETTPANRVEI